MRIFTEGPKVILLARPSVVKEGIAEALIEYGQSVVHGWRRGDDDGDGEGLPEFMGRVCYGSFGTRQGRIGATDYFAHVLGAGHGSVLEHACFSFLVTRASRAFTHQIVRHRAGVAPSQESQHFVRYSIEDEEVGAQETGVCMTGVPEALRPSWLASVECAIRDYAAVVARLKVDGLGKKEACELARGLLPNCLESRIGLTMNARAIRHVVELRGQPGNALEIRLFAVRLAELMKTEAPALFQDIRVVADAGDGRPAVKAEWRKV